MVARSAGRGPRPRPIACCRLGPQPALPSLQGQTWQKWAEEATRRVPSPCFAPFSPTPTLSSATHIYMKRPTRCGEVAEWLNAPHSKCGMGATPSGVQIPPSPPLIIEIVIEILLRQICPKICPKDSIGSWRTAAHYCERCLWTETDISRLQGATLTVSYHLVEKDRTLPTSVKLPSRLCSVLSEIRAVPVHGHLSRPARMDPSSQSAVMNARCEPMHL
jgi:hypothetical protein